MTVGEGLPRERLQGAAFAQMELEAVLLKLQLNSKVKG